MRRKELNERVLRYLSVVQDPKVEKVRAAFFARREKAIEAAQAKPAAVKEDTEDAE
jgi:hypothetical protein